MKFIKLLNIFVFCFGIVHAQGFSKVGTTAAPFLKIEAGARAVAMGGNFVALADDPTALYWNPAGITQLQRTSISGTHSEWFADIKHDYVSLITPLSSSSAVGIDFIYLSSGNIEQTTIEEQEGNGILYQVTDLAFGITYARKLTDRFSVAVKAKYIQQKIFREESSSIAFDFGTLFDTGFKGLRIGMNFANFGRSMQMDGSDLSVLQENPYTGETVETRLETESWPLPIIFRVGIALDILSDIDGIVRNSNNRFTITVDGNHPNDNRETIGAGLEYVWKELLALRMGYKHNHDSQDLSFGGGLNFVLGGWNASLDYAYAKMGILEAVQRFSFGIAF
jgi:hypothetical protein